MGEPVPGSGELFADWGKEPPTATGGYIDTRPPLKGDRPFREANIALLNGQNLPIWIAYAAKGPRVSLLYAIKHPDQKPQVVEMDRRAAKLLVSRFPALGKNKPTMVVAMPSGSWQAGHFAEEVAKAANLPLKTGVFKKTGAIKGTYAAKKMDWARASYKLASNEDFEGQSVILADDNVGTGSSMAACAEILYGRGAAYVLGVATFRITGKKDPEAEDVRLSMAKKVRKAIEPSVPPAPEQGEEDEQQEDAPRHKTEDRDESVIAFLVDNKADIPTMTFRELVEMCDTTDVEMRFALAQLGLAKLVKPG